MTDSFVRVPEISHALDGRDVDCEVIVRDGVSYYKQRTNSHMHSLDAVTGVYTPVNGKGGVPFGMDYREAVARGYIAGATPFASSGERTTTGGETNYPVWPDGAFTVPPVGGLQMSIVSTSANDSAAGSNARSIEIHYLDANLNSQSEIVIMNGVTPVLTVATDIRFIQCMHIHTYGTIQYTAGYISATNGGATYAVISAVSVRCTSSFRMVPAGKRLFVDGAIGSSISGTSSTNSIIRLVASELDNHQYVYPLILIPVASLGMQDGSESYNFTTPLVLSAGTVVGFTHTSDKAAVISASWFGRLEDA